MEITARLWQPVAGGMYVGVAPSVRLPIYTRGNAGEVFPEVQYPLSFTMSWDLSVKAFMDATVTSGILARSEVEGDPSALVGCFGGYSYLNLSAMRVLSLRVPGTKVEQVDRQYLGVSDAPPHVRKRGDRSVRAAWNGVLYGIATLRLKDLPQQRTDAARVEAWRRTLPDPQHATDSEILAAMRSEQPFIGELFRNHLIVSAKAGVPVAILTAMCTKKLNDLSLLGRMLGGTGGIASAEPSERLWDLGRMVLDSPRLTQHFDAGVRGLGARLAADHDTADHDTNVDAFTRAFAEFLDQHGCRGPNEWETARPTWGTNPELAYALVDRMRAADPDHAPAHRHELLTADRERALAEATAKLSKLGARRLRSLVASAGLLAQGRELAKTTVIRAIHESRLLMRELARRCAERSGGAADDLWFVDAAELDSYVADPTAFIGRIAERRAVRELLASREPPFVVQGVVPPFETWVRRDAPSAVRVVAGQRLEGIAGCAGVARGRARIVTDPGDPRGIGPGDVLVAPLTDPSWTPLFVPVEAVVVDVGAVLSHAVIVSRELGIPSVVSVTGATKCIPDGALIEVDGTNGTVTIIELP